MPSWILKVATARNVLLGAIEPGDTALLGTFGRLAGEAGANPELEKAGLLPPSPDQPDADRRRPTDVYLPSWFGGVPAALDLAITSPQRQDTFADAAVHVGAAAEAYELYKRSDLNTEADCRAQGIAFVPLVAETSGGWGPYAR